MPPPTQATLLHTPLSTTPYSSIDLAIEKLSGQKHKTRHERDEEPPRQRGRTRQARCTEARFAGVGLTLPALCERVHVSMYVRGSGRAA